MIKADQVFTIHITIYRFRNSLVTLLREYLSFIHTQR